MTLQDHNTINELIKFYQKNRSEADYKKGIQPIDGHKIDGQDRRPDDVQPSDGS